MDTFIVTYKGDYFPELILDSWKIEDVYNSTIVHVDSIIISTCAQYPKNCYVTRMCKIGNRILLKLSQRQKHGKESCYIGLVTLVYLIDKNGKLTFDYEFLKVKQLEWLPDRFCSKSEYYYHIDDETSCFDKIRIYDMKNKGNEVGVIEATSFRFRDIFLLDSIMLLRVYEHCTGFYMYEKDGNFVDLSILLKSILSNSVWVLKDFVIYEIGNKLIIGKLSLSPINNKINSSSRYTFNIINTIQLENHTIVHGRKEYIYIDEKIRQCLIIDVRSYLRYVYKIFVYEKNENVCTKITGSGGYLLDYEVKFSGVITEKCQHYISHHSSLFFIPRDAEEFISLIVKNSVLIRDLCHIIFQYYFYPILTV